MQGQKIALGGTFVSPTGARMKFPGDTSQNAGPADVINCRCVASYKVDWLAQTLSKPQEFANAA